MPQDRPTIAYLIDPRFPGGTSAAVAQELLALAEDVRPTVACLETAMFAGNEPAPVLEAAFQRLGIAPRWNPPVVAADVVVIHNPVFLKFETELRTRIVARRVIVVTHENLLRPGGAEAFDVGHCLRLVERASLCLRRDLAPVSAINRAGVRDWLAAGGGPGRWGVLDEDWFNVCDFPALPAGRPRDRRGRHSRPGFEKFPALEVMDACFPPQAEANVILGADLYMAEGLVRPHWQMHAFRSVPVPDHLAAIDFQIHFTAPTWRESFGRVLAEGLAAGKVVISDPDTAAGFGGAVLSAAPQDVTAIVAAFVADPPRYAAQVARGQDWIARHGAAQFRALLHRVLDGPQERAA